MKIAGVFLGLTRKSRSKKIIDTLSKVILTIAYDRILKTETGRANKIRKILIKTMQLLHNKT